MTGSVRFRFRRPRRLNGLSHLWRNGAPGAISRPCFVFCVLVPGHLIVEWWLWLMSHAKHLFKGQPLCRRCPFAQSSSPSAIVPLLWFFCLGCCFGSLMEGWRDSGQLGSLQANGKLPVKAAGLLPSASRSVGIWSEPSQLVWAGSTENHQSVPRCCAHGRILILFLYQSSKQGLTQCPMPRAHRL